MTTSARSASRSVTLPLPSSPHWAPTTTSPGTSCRLLSVCVRAAAGTSRVDAVRGGRRSVEVALPVHVGELRVTAQERQHDVADGTVAVLGDDDVGLARALRVAVVVLVPVDEHHQVGVLLDLAGLA